jgi:hypothetical protein
MVGFQRVSQFRPGPTVKHSCICTGPRHIHPVHEAETLAARSGCFRSQEILTQLPDSRLRLLMFVR